MTREQMNYWQTKAEYGKVPDEKNPVFILSLTDSELLSEVAKGKLNLQELAKRELENRGLNINGKWVGFKTQIK